MQLFNRIGSIGGTRVTAVALGAALLGGCNKNWHVDRVDPSRDINLTFRFNENDAQIVFAGMINDALARPWIDRWEAANDRQAPIIFVGRVRNDTEDYIDTLLFTKKMEQELLNSGRVRVVADPTQRDELRDERAEQQQWARAETVKQTANELGADLAMIGRVGDVKQFSSDERRVVSYYQVNLELVDIESNEKVWVGTEEVKKTARR